MKLLTYHKNLLQDKIWYWVSHIRKHFQLLFGKVSDFHRFHKESKGDAVFFIFFLLPSQKSYISSCGWGRVTLSFKGTWGSSYQESHQALLCRCCAISAFMSIGCAFLSPQQHLCTEQVVHALESGTAELSTPFYHLLACIAPSACPCSVFPHFLLDKSQRGW